MKILNELQLAKELIRFPTVTPVDAGIMKFLGKKLKKLGFNTKILTAETKAAIELFMSFAPLPIKCPFLIEGLKGFTVQSFKFPAGTTSKWPA